MAVDEQEHPARWRVEVEATWTIRRTVEVMAETREEAGAKAEQSVQVGMLENPTSYTANGMVAAEAVRAEELEDA